MTPRSNIVYVQDRSVCIAVPSVTSDFQADLREQLTGQLRREGYEIPDLSKDKDVHIMWGNVRLRHIPRHPRRVLWSKELRRRPLDADTKRSIRRICTASQRGENLNPHLSRKHLTASFNDLLFNDWRIHHMHLGPRGGKKAGRTQAIVFALVTKDVLHLLDLLDHGDDETVFADVRLVEIMYRNFPKAMPLPHISTIHGCDPISREQRHRARKGGVQTFVMIDGKVFGPAHGIATSGDNVRAVAATDQLRDAVNELERDLRVNPYRLAEAVFQATGTRPPVLRFKLLAGGTTFSAVELNSGFKAAEFEFTFNH